MGIAIRSQENKSLAFSGYHFLHAEVESLFRLIRLELEIRKFLSTNYAFLSQISNLIKCGDVISIEELYPKYQSSQDIDTHGSLSKFIS